MGQWLNMADPALPSLLFFHSQCTQFASKLVQTVETMDAGTAEFDAGWAAEGGGGDEWQ